MKRKILSLLLVALLMFTNIMMGVTATEYESADDDISEINNKAVCETAVLDYGKIPKEYTNQRKIQLAPELFSNMYGTRSRGVYNSNTEILYLSTGILRLAVYWNNHLYVNDYSSDYTLLESRDICLDISDWGGVCLGEESSYVFYGKCDAEEDSSEYYVTKYDVDFNEKATVTLNQYAIDTLDLFGFSNVAMGLRDHTLTIFTDRNYSRRFSNYYAFAIKIDVRTMDDSNPTITFVEPGNIGISGEPYRNILGFDGDKPVYAVVSGDDYPGGVYIRAGNSLSHLTPDTALGDNENNENPILTDAANMAVSSSHYLVATIFENYGINNIYLATKEKGTGNISGRFLTNATAFNTEINGNPWIVDLGSDRFALLWERIELGMVNVCSVLLDASGTPIGQVQVWQDCFLSESAPICSGERILWVTAENGEMELHQLRDLDASGYQELDNGIVEGDTIWNGTSDISWYQDNKTDYTISTAEQLAGLAELVNAGNDFSGKVIRLNNDLFMNSSPFGHIEGNQWIPIGASEDDNAVFNGTFDGQCHTIYNMVVPADGLDGGLFGTIGAAGTVKCLTLEQGWFENSACVADINHGNVLFCMAKSYVEDSSGEPRGGVCRYNYGLIYGCQYYGFIEYSNQCGGIVYRNESGGTISQCANKGLLYTSRNTFTHTGTSGIAYNNYGWIYNCYNLGVMNNGSNRSAGIVGYSDGDVRCGQIYNCYSLSGYPLRAPIYIHKGNFAEVENCFGNTEPGAEWYTEFCEAEFLKQLDEQLGPMVSAWLPDTLGINNGLPITVAEYNYHTGNYKVQPELWGVSPSVTVCLSEQDTISLANVKFYYSDATLEITSDNVNVAEIINGNIQLHSTGSANIRFHLDETDMSTALDYTTTITVKEHDYGAWTEVKSATCTTVGEERRDCVNCDVFETREISALGHSYTASVTRPNCTDKGYTAYQCTRCGDSKVDSYVDALGHKTELKNAKDATCTESGYTGDEVCTVCGETVKKGETIAALGHNYESVATAPTCTDQGYTTHTCARCDDSKVDSYVDALGHKTELKNAKDATCTESGYTGDEICTVCGETVKKGETIAVLGHNYESVVTAPTCTEKGYTTHTCAHCGDSYVDSNVDALGHKTELKKAKDATCTETGYTGDEICTVCGETIKKGETVAALGHDYQSVVTDPTCTEQGYTTHTCTRCGDSKVDSYVDALGHKTVLENDKDATCTEDGYTGDEICTVCGETVKKGETIAALGHSFGQWTATTEPTCTKAGEEARTCSVCGETEKREVAALGHKLTLVAGKEPGFTEPGMKEHYVCEVCGKLFADEAGTVEVTAEELVIPQLIQIVDGNVEISEEAVDKAIDIVENGGEIRLPISDAGQVKSVTMPAKALSKVAELDASLTVEMTAATVTMDTAALEAVAQKLGEDDVVTLKIAQIPTEYLTAEQQAAVKDKNVVGAISAQLLVNDQPIGSEAAGGFGDGRVTVQIPFIPDPGTTAEDYKVLYVAADGTITEIPIAYEDGCLVMAVGHFSEYVIVKTKTVMLGDVNGDGKITVTDLMCLANHFAGKAEINEANSDLDGNGKVTVTDLMRLANVFAGKATLG